MEEFKRTTNGFNYVYEKNVPAGSMLYLKMPTISPNKRGINDVGFAYEDGITLYGTLARKPDGQDVIWQEIQPFDEINKTVSYIKIVNSSGKNAKINIRAILN